MASTRKTLRAINLFLTPPPLSLALANNPFPLRRPPPRIPHSSSHYPPTHCARTMSKSRRTVSHSPSSLHALLHQLAWGEATEANPPREQSAQGDYWGGRGSVKGKEGGLGGGCGKEGGEQGEECATTTTTIAASAAAAARSTPAAAAALLASPLVFLFLRWWWW